jgi:hypothetical protein
MKRLILIILISMMLVLMWLCLTIAVLCRTLNFKKTATMKYALLFIAEIGLIAALSAAVARVRVMLTASTRSRRTKVANSLTATISIFTCRRAPAAAIRLNAKRFRGIQRTGVSATANARLTTSRASRLVSYTVEVIVMVHGSQIHSVIRTKNRCGRESAPILRRVHHITMRLVHGVDAVPLVAVELDHVLLSVTLTVLQ